MGIALSIQASLSAGLTRVAEVAGIDFYRTLLAPVSLGQSRVIAILGGGDVRDESIVRGAEPAVAATRSHGRLQKIEVTPSPEETSPVSELNNITPPGG